MLGARALKNSLSARLLVLTAFFVMVSEVLIFVPSVARYRMTYFENHLAAGRLAMLALEASPTDLLDQDLVNTLLAHVGAHGVELRRTDGTILMLDRSTPPAADVRIDLSHASIWGAIRGSFITLFHGGNRLLRVLGPAPLDRSETVEVLLDEAPLRHELWNFGTRILELSIVISLFTASLVYLALHWLLVRPMRRITASMVEFRDDPEDASRVIAASARGDEIGMAERELAIMQETVRQALGQHARLAALGTAVTKINHDLRNILATARLVTDGLTASAAPEVRRILPRLLDAIDRAAALCTRTLDFSREGAPPLSPRRFVLAPLLDELAADFAAAGLTIKTTLPAALEIDADRDQLYRVFANLARNSAEAGARHLQLLTLDAGETLNIEVADDGPGLPPKARDNLFRPFFGSARPGGSGLGLAIARELMRAHGGDLVLLATGETGTVFRLSLPLPTPRTARRHRAAEPIF
jgi:signal transduction histidine kinase